MSYQNDIVERTICCYGNSWGSRRGRLQFDTISDSELNPIGHQVSFRRHYFSDPIWFLKVYTDGVAYWRPAVYSPHLNTPTRRSISRTIQRYFIAVEQIRVEGEDYDTHILKRRKCSLPIGSSATGVIEFGDYLLHKFNEEVKQNVV